MDGGIVIDAEEIVLSAVIAESFTAKMYFAEGKIWKGRKAAGVARGFTASILMLAARAAGL